MLVALWIIAVCEIIRALQNLFPIVTHILEAEERKRCYSEFIKNLKEPDREWVKNLLEEFEKENG